MWIKNGRIIINEDCLKLDIKRLEKELRTFFKTDPRFCMSDIGVFVEFDDECCCGGHCDCDDCDCDDCDDCHCDDCDCK